jgi:hypothetical protein
MVNYLLKQLKVFTVIWSRILENLRKDLHFGTSHNKKALPLRNAFRLYVFNLFELQIDLNLIF